MQRLLSSIALGAVLISLTGCREPLGSKGSNASQGATSPPVTTAADADIDSKLKTHSPDGNFLIGNCLAALEFSACTESEGRRYGVPMGIDYEIFESDGTIAYSWAPAALPESERTDSTFKTVIRYFPEIGGMSNSITVEKTVQNGCIIVIRYERLIDNEVLLTTLEPKGTCDDYQIAALNAAAAIENSSEGGRRLKLISLTGNHSDNVTDESVDAVKHRPQLNAEEIEMSKAGLISREDALLCIGHLGYKGQLQSTMPGRGHHETFIQTTVMYSFASSLGIPIGEESDRYRERLESLSSASSQAYYESTDSRCSRIFETNPRLQMGVAWLTESGRRIDAGLPGCPLTDSVCNGVPNPGFLD